MGTEDELELIVEPFLLVFPYFIFQHLKKTAVRGRDAAGINAESAAGLWVAIKKDTITEERSEKRLPSSRRCDE